jgi:lantibiotic modifying enzyme
MNNKYISDMLMLKSSFIKHDGLVHGKMGIAIALAHLSRVENNKLYLRYAEQLIEQFYYSISAHTPTDFEDGLSGIAWPTTKVSVMELLAIAITYSLGQKTRFWKARCTMIFKLG